MKNNKLALILAALLLLSCAACGKTETPPAGNDPAQETPDTPQTPDTPETPDTPAQPDTPPADPTVPEEPVQPLEAPVLTHWDDGAEKALTRPARLSYLLPETEAGAWEGTFLPLDGEKLLLWQGGSDGGTLWLLDAGRGTAQSALRAEDHAGDLMQLPDVNRTAALRTGEQLYAISAGADGSPVFTPYALEKLGETARHTVTQTGAGLAVDGTVVLQNQSSGASAGGQIYSLAATLSGDRFLFACRDGSGSVSYGLYAIDRGEKTMLSTPGSTLVAWGPEDALFRDARGLYRMDLEDRDIDRLTLEDPAAADPDCDEGFWLTGTGGTVADLGDGETEWSFVLPEDVTARGWLPSEDVLMLLLTREDGAVLLSVYDLND